MPEKAINRARKDAKTCWLSRELQFNDPAFNSDHCGLSAIVSPQFGKDVLDLTFHGVFRD